MRCHLYNLNTSCFPQNLMEKSNVSTNSITVILVLNYYGDCHSHVNFTKYSWCYGSNHQPGPGHHCDSKNTLVLKFWIFFSTSLTSSPEN